MTDDVIGLLAREGFERADLQFILGPDGRLLTEDPGLRFGHAQSRQRHAYGLGPFCRFKVISAPRSPGLYAFVNDASLR
jgi:hypothetical protein